MIKELASLLNERTTLVLSLAKEGDKVRLCVIPNRGLPPLTATDTPENFDAKLVEALTKYTSVVKPLADAVEEVAKVADTAKAKAEAIAAARKTPPAKPDKRIKCHDRDKPRDVTKLADTVPATTDAALFGQKVEAVRKAAEAVRSEIAALGLPTPEPAGDQSLDDFLGTPAVTTTTA